MLKSCQLMSQFLLSFWPFSPFITAPSKSSSYSLILK